MSDKNLSSFEVKMKKKMQTFKISIKSEMFDVANVWWMGNLKYTIISWVSK